MQGRLIDISSLELNDVEGEFDNVLEKEKYACFLAPDIENIGTKFDYWLYHLTSRSTGSLLKRLRMTVKL